MSYGWIWLEEAGSLLQNTLLSHFLTGALKSYLRELPEPLMTSELYNEWFEAAG